MGTAIFQSVEDLLDAKLLKICNIFEEMTRLRITIKYTNQIALSIDSSKKYYSI